MENATGIQKIALDIEARRIELGKTSGFERMYHRVAKLYFGGMARHFADLLCTPSQARRPTSLRCGRPGIVLARYDPEPASFLPRSRSR